MRYIYCAREEIFFSLFFNKRLIVNHKFFAAVYMTRTRPAEYTGWGAAAVSEAVEFAKSSRITSDLLRHSEGDPCAPSS